LANEQPKVPVDRAGLKLRFPALTEQEIAYVDTNLFACLSTFSAGEAKALVWQSKRPNRLRGVEASALAVQLGNGGAVDGEPEEDHEQNIPLAQLGGEIVAWENRIVEYEAKPGADVVSDNLKEPRRLPCLPGGFVTILT
jgi:hypothetical protein